MTGLPVSEQKRVFDSILGAMVQTPLVRLGRIAKDLPVPLYAKLEFMNPGGSVNRVGTFIIEQAKKRGELEPGGTVVEAAQVSPAREEESPNPESIVVRGRY